MKLELIPKRFQAKSLVVIEQAENIIREYEAQGYKLTLRQLYYQFVARDLIENSQRSYKKLGKTISDARMAGLISWDAIEDRTRNLRSNYHNDSVADALKDSLDHFSLNRWDNQPNYVEVWIEKDALLNVIAPVCERLDVPYFACRGYTSASEMWSAGQRYIHADCDNGKFTHLIHLGDHDPSGLDMTRDVLERIQLFTGCGVDVKRIALNMDQVEQYTPPPNPTKMTDTRVGNYLTRYGKSSWELDALEPQVISDLLESTITQLIDLDRWQETEHRELQGRSELQSVLTQFQETRL